MVVCQNQQSLRSDLEAAQDATLIAIRNSERELAQGTPPPAVSRGVCRVKTRLSQNTICSTKQTFVLKCSDVEQQFALIPPKMAALRERCDSVAQGQDIQLQEIQSKVDSIQQNSAAKEDLLALRLQSEVREWSHNLS